MSRVTNDPKHILIAHGRLEKNEFVVIPEGITIYTYAKSGNSVNSNSNIGNVVRIYEEGSIMPEMNLDFNSYLPPGPVKKLKYSVPGLVLPTNISPKELPKSLHLEYITKENFNKNNGAKHVMKNIKNRSFSEHYNVFEKSNAPGAQAFKKDIKLSVVLREVSKKKYKGIIGLFACRGCDVKPFANLPGSKNSILRNGNSVATPRNSSNVNDLNPPNYLTKFWIRSKFIKDLRFCQVGLTIPKNANSQTKMEIKHEMSQIKSLKDVIKNIYEKANETCVLTKSELSVYIKIWFYLRNFKAKKNGIEIENKLLNKEDGVTYNKLTRYIKNKGVNVEVPSEVLRRGFLL